LGIGEK
jgi:hypothetical protein